jgi:hypothetical protein
MKQSVQILFLALFLFSLSGFAREETMEERKKRITRKYMRTRATLLQSDSEVPSDEIEDENVVDSERFLEPQVDFQRQEAGAPMPMPPPRRPVPKKKNKNWLLAEDPMMEDPYADPFAPKEPEEKTKAQDWSNWGRQEVEETSPYDRTPHDSWFQSRNADPSVQQNSGQYDQAGQNPFSSQNSQSFPGSSLQQGRPSADGRSPFSTGNLDLSRDKIFSPGSEQSRLSSPFPQKESTVDRSFGSDSSLKKGGYTPYKSPYETRREQQKQPWGGVRAPQQDYQKPDAFKQWKSKNSTFDPTSDDAFIDEVMPGSRR